MDIFNKASTRGFGKLRITTTEVEESECCAARVIQVVETKFARGNGTDNDPVRIVTQYWSLDGAYLAESVNDDPYTVRGVEGRIERLEERLAMYKRHLAECGVTSGDQNH